MAKNYLYNLLLTLSNILFPILSFPYAAHVLGPEGIGKVQFVVSFAQYFALFAALGIPIYGVQEIARHKHDKELLSKAFSELLSIFFFASVLVSVIYVAILLSFSYFDNSIDLYMYGGIVILFGFSYIDWYCAGVEDFRSIALRSVAIKVLALILLYTFVKTPADYIYFLLITIFSISGNHVSGLLFGSSDVRFSFRNLNVKKHLKPLFYIFSTTIAASMYTVLDVVLLGFLSNDRAVGYYTAAIKLTKITIPFVTSMGVVLMPKISSKIAEKQSFDVQSLLAKAFDFLVLIAIPATFGLMLLTPEFISLFSGVEFLPATFSMQILSVLPIIIGFGHFFAFLVLVPHGKNREMFLSVIVGMVIGLILNFILIPRFAEAGASIANVITEIIVTCCYFYFVKRDINYSYQWTLIVKAILSALLFIPIILLVREAGMDLIPSLSISIGTCALFYLAIQLFIFKNSVLLSGRDYLLKKAYG